MAIQKPIKIAFFTTTILWLAASSGAADTFPHPKVEFSADMTMIIRQADTPQPHTIQGKIYSIKGKERREISSFGRQTVIINDRDNDQMWTLMPDQKMVMANAHPGARKDPARMIQDGELKITEMGTEKVNGKTTTKYKIESTDKSEAVFSGFAWLNKQNIPVRFQGTASEGGIRQDIEIEYTNIVVARQDPQLFVVPADYRQMDTGLGAMGTSGKTLTPEQMEQVMKMLKQKQ
ncbi:MAG: DUF4412 domain-containing protein [Desulfobacteraceae bacterium]|jgi:hypothetical protein|nr:DUF4412 domain-containing protein [Desulfobacteraceae bacterium]